MIMATMPPHHGGIHILPCLLYHCNPALTARRSTQSRTLCRETAIAHFDDITGNNPYQCRGGVLLIVMRLRSMLI
jgi:hypothetical protein